MNAVPLSAARVRAWIPRRPADSHKGLNGHVLIVAGSRGMGGAPILAALGALRAGAGLVTVALPEPERRPLAARVPEALTLPLPGTPKGSLGPADFSRMDRYIQARRVNAVALGPGLSVSPSLRQLVLKALRIWKMPFVLDADGLNNVSEADLRACPALVVTPHPGEMARLTRQDKRTVQTEGPALARKLARRGRLVCVLKGHHTFVTDGQRSYRNTTGNPAMASGGAGDVLTGVLAALMAQGLKPLEAAAAAVYLHGLAGDLARVSDRGLLATDLAAALPAALKRIGVR